MKKIKFGISMIPFLLAGSIAANAGVSAYENRPREFEEITDCSNIDKVTYEKYEKISYQDFYKKLKKNNSEFLIEYKIVETSEENRTILDSDYILNEREYLAFHAFNRQNRNLLEAIENGEIEIKEIHYIHHVALEGDEVKNFNIEDAYLTENLNDVEMEKVVKQEWLRYVILLAISLPGILWCSSRDYYTGLGMLIGMTAAVPFEKKYVNFRDTRNPFAMILRVAGAFAIYLVLNKVLKMPFSTEWLDSGKLVPNLVRTARYAIILFIVIGVYPKVFPVFEKIRFGKE